MATLLKIRQRSVDMEPELWLATQEARCVCVCWRNAWHQLQDKTRATGIIRYRIHPKRGRRCLYRQSSQYCTITTMSGNGLVLPSISKEYIFSHLCRNASARRAVEI